MGYGYEIRRMEVKRKRASTFRSDKHVWIFENLASAKAGIYLYLQDCKFWVSINAFRLEW